MAASGEKFTQPALTCSNCVLKFCMKFNLYEILPRINVVRTHETCFQQSHNPKLKYQKTETQNNTGAFRIQSTPISAKSTALDL